MNNFIHKKKSRNNFYLTGFAHFFWFSNKISSFAHFFSFDVLGYLSTLLMFVTITNTNKNKNYYINFVSFLYEVTLM